MRAEWGDWVVLVKLPEEKRSWLLSDRGRLTRLRIRAVRFTKENAAKACAELAKENPRYTFKPKEIKHHARTV